MNFVVMSMKKIDLENMEGEEFEKLCQDIFSKYYETKVDITPPVNDGGKDLIIRFPEGAAYVECKHHPRSSIGRPVVQKLHSAMTTDWVTKGYIVTTGTFSKQAVEHIEKNTLPIELIDGKQLKEMAESVGYELFYGYDVRIPIEVIPYPGNDALETRFKTYLDKSFVSTPKKPSEYVELKSTDVEMKILFKVDYNIHQEFYNTRKDDLIYKIDDAGTTYLHSDLEPIDDVESDFISKGTSVPLSEYDGPSFNIEINQIRSDIEDKAYQSIIEKYTCDHEYVTTNNQYRTKHIIPSKKNIELYNIYCICVPVVSSTYRLANKNYDLNSLCNGTDFIIMTHNQCEYCKRTLRNPMICNDCGMIVCDDHGYRCSICNKTLCFKCTSYYTKSLIFKKYICSDCAEKNPKLKVKKLF